MDKESFEMRWMKSKRVRELAMHGIIEKEPETRSESSGLDAGAIYEARRTQTAAAPKLPQTGPKNAPGDSLNSSVGWPARQGATPQARSEQLLDADTIYEARRAQVEALRAAD